MISFENVTKRYHGDVIAVGGLSFAAPTGKMTVLVGPSGCGKTTSLRMINRLVRPTSGTIRLGDEPTEGMDEAKLRRRIGYVIQHAGLFPHRNVVDNIATTARLNGTPKDEARKIALELLGRVGLSDDFALRYPWQLSGGQQQRVGVARALASNPKFMLMDEPFSAVDPIVRTQLQDEFLRLQREMGKTIIMVTHDIDEALKLGDQVAVLRVGGELAQIATPRELLTRPADKFVADFVGRDRGYRFLGFVGAGDRLMARKEVTAKLGDSAAAMIKTTADQWLLVTDEADRPIGWAQPSTLRSTIEMADVNLSGTTASIDGSLRQLLDAALSSPSRRGVIVDDDGRFIGCVTLPDLVALLERGADIGTPIQEGKHAF
ncbi:ATP-binding cassette domain-containing protein [Agrobacterium tumefaciens]|uniref:ATP-binding cassette domain-containing protein n=1 Tax=Agrobacterium tumefaciens TaxID=358 RepID=UPI001572C2A0|nr:ABC transporter ATP-binding protein [Agrobacterium tumefaciens]NTD91537.1 ABC transporter ATP-binding protein [Agrobacterium tumefaciens]NTD95522.1 ABC transporter ATP-binding protein [Agrobacterium tumefaciens]NTE11632.1 ABC transporter ATP-binding protein [Agrobacterium tumefaciens]NTE25077.1 ABC transporter ATP-binding protein [Agrobacterium tumefaciens]